MALTDARVKQVKPGPKPVKLSDGKGLYLLVNPNGSKLWRWKYRVLGKEKTMALGIYPDKSLARARGDLSEARKLLAAGADPMAVRKADKVAMRTASENSFESVAREWWAHWKPARSEQHAGQVMRRFEANVFPHIGARPITDVQAPELVTMLKGHRIARGERSGKTRSANVQSGFPVRRRARQGHAQPGHRHQAQRRAGVAPEAEPCPDRRQGTARPVGLYAPRN